MHDDLEDEFENEFGEDFEDFDLESEQANLEGSDTFAPEPATRGATPHLKKLAGLGAIVLTIGIATFFIFSDPSEDEITLAEKPLPPPSQKTAQAKPTIEPVTEPIAQRKPRIPPPQTQEQAKPIFEDDLFREQQTLAEEKKPTATTTTANTDEDTPKLFDTISGIKKELFGDEEQSQAEAEREAFSVQQTQALQQALNIFSQKMQTNTDQIQTLEHTLTEVAKALNGVSNNVNQINNDVSDLSNTTQILSKEYKNIKKVIQSEDLDVTSDPIDGKAKTKPITYTGPEYVVHAVIPGRAWLKSQNGEIITVSEGDHIGNYGKILVIDAANGVIMTSSGIAFR